jgi:hypothetical protein
VPSSCIAWRSSARIEREEPPIDLFAAAISAGVPRFVTQAASPPGASFSVGRTSDTGIEWTSDTGIEWTSDTGGMREGFTGLTFCAVSPVATSWRALRSCGVVFTLERGIRAEVC